MHESVYVIVPVLLFVFAVMGFLLWLEISTLQRNSEDHSRPIVHKDEPDQYSPAYRIQSEEAVGRGAPPPQPGLTASPK